MYSKKGKSMLEVDCDGLRKQIESKPKWRMLLELVQNAIDELITLLSVTCSYCRGKATFEFVDDAPDGFDDLKDAYTLYRHSKKQANPEQRGRFNVGEKFLITICKTAKITSTKGTVLFKNNKRYESAEKTEKGTVVTVEIVMSEDEYEDCVTNIKSILVPKGINYQVNGDAVKHKEAFIEYTDTLPTVIETDGVMRKTKRQTKIHIHETEKALLFELGIPVCEIDCQFSVDVQQKIPLNTDRETVSQAFLKELYAGVINNTANAIKSEDASENWVRTGCSDSKIQKEALATIIEKRFGENAVIVNPRDSVANDEAIIGGYRLLHGAELTKGEWDNVKRDNLLPTTSSIFPSAGTNAVVPNEAQEKVAALTKKVGKELLGILVNVLFINPEAPSSNLASFDPKGNVLTYNIAAMGEDLFKAPLKEELLSIIIHELAHSKGLHAEKAYINCITDIGAKLAFIVKADTHFLDLE